MDSNTLNRTSSIMREKISTRIRRRSSYIDYITAQLVESLSKPLQLSLDIFNENGRSSSSFSVEKKTADRVTSLTKLEVHLISDLRSAVELSDDYHVELLHNLLKCIQ